MASLQFFHFVLPWLVLTDVSQAAACRNLWVDPRKYPKLYVRQWAVVSRSASNYKDKLTISAL